MKKKRIKYRSELPRLLYAHFLSYSEGGLPSFDKFARGIGSTYEQLESFRSHDEFDRAWRECIEIRRDYLIDGALTRRFDPSFAKFLLSEEAAGTEGGTGEEKLEVLLTVRE